MNIVSKNTIMSASQNHSIKNNNMFKSENIKESIFKNFEDYKIKMYQKREER